MSLAYLKIHHRTSGHNLTACGRLAPTWARRTSSDPDYVTCETCLDVLVLDSLIAIQESRMSTEEVLRRGQA